MCASHLNGTAAEPVSEPSVGKKRLEKSQETNPEKGCAHVFIHIHLTRSSLCPPPFAIFLVSAVYFELSKQGFVFYICDAVEKCSHRPFFAVSIRQ